MYKGNTVGVVVPAYNESEHVGEVIDTLPAFVDRVYVVDDASTDDTWDQIQSKSERANERARAVADGGTFQRRIVPIRHGENRGVGGAIKTGYVRAREEELDVTAVIAGDGQMDPDMLDRLLDPVVEGRAGYAKGNRLLAPADHSEMPPLRFVGNVMLTFLTKLASGYWGIGDPQNGYTAISREALETAPVEDMYEYYGYCNDLLVKLNVEGVSVVDVSMPAAYGDEESHIRYQHYVPRVSTMLFRSFLYRLKAKYVVDDFHPLVFLYALGTIGAGSWMAGAFRHLLSRRSSSERTESRVLALLSGLVLVLAMIYDRSANQHLDQEPMSSDESR